MMILGTGEFIGLIYGRYIHFRILKFPLMNGLVSFSEVFIEGECIRLDNGGLQMRLHKENT